MQAYSTSTAIQVSRPTVVKTAATATPLGLLDRLLRRRKPTLYHRCLAVHIAQTGTLSALR